MIIKSNNVNKISHIAHVISPINIEDLSNDTKFAKKNVLIPYFF